jgi:hypothetical protein
MACTGCRKESAPDVKQISSDEFCPMFRMSDGRSFTDYRTRCAQDADLRNAAPSSMEYRMYMVHNAQKLMEQQYREYSDKTKCKRCYRFDENGTMLPEESKVVCNDRTCKRVVGSGLGGLGQGRVYQGSGELVMPKVTHYPAGGLDVDGGSYGAALL